MPTPLVLLNYYHWSLQNTRCFDLLDGEPWPTSFPFWRTHVKKIFRASKGLLCLVGGGGAAGERGIVSLARVALWGAHF